MAKFKSSNKIGILVVLAAMIIFFSIMSNAFFTVDNFLNVFRQVSMLGIASVGFVFVLLTGGIDLSIGSQVTFVNILCAYLMINVGMDPFLAVIICVACTTGFGLINGLIITKLNVLPLITTLCMMNILRGISYIICTGMPIFGFPKSFSFLGQGYIGPIPFPVILMVIAFAVGGFILAKTYFGRYFYAVGGNEEAAALSGVNITRTKISVYALCGLFAGIAGVIWLSRVNSGQPVTGLGFEFDVLTAVVLGGVSTAGGEGDIAGAIIGVIVIGLLNNGLVLINVSEYFQLVIKGVVLLVAVAADSKRRMKKKVVLKTV